MTTEALHAPQVDGRAMFAQEVAIACGSSQHVLEAVRRIDVEALDGRAVSGLGRRRHVIARLVQHSERSHALLADRPHVDDAAILRLPLGELVDRLDTTLTAVVSALEAEVASPTYAALVACSEQRAWLELTRADLQADGIWVTAGEQPRDPAAASPLA